MDLAAFFDLAASGKLTTGINEWCSTSYMQHRLTTGSSAVL
jgi:hypothetical protein